MRKTIFIAIVFTLICAYLGPTFFQGGDYLSHFAKAKDGCESSSLLFHQVIPCEGYTPLYHWISSIFSFNENAFFFFSLFLFVFLFPLIIYYYTRNWYATLVYFCASNYVWYFVDGIFPQALAQIFIFILYFTKDHRIEAGLIPLIILAHGSGFMAALFVMFFKYVDVNGWLCSSVFGANPENKPEILYQRIGSSGGLDFGVNNVVHFFTKTFPIPFMIIALKEAWDSNQRTFALLLFLIVAGFVHAPRVWYLAFLLAIPSIASFYQKQDRNGRILLLAFTLIYGVIQIYLFWNYNVVCV